MYTDKSGAKPAAKNVSAVTYFPRTSHFHETGARNHP